MRLKPQRLSNAAILIAVAAALRAILALAVRSWVARKFGIASGETDAYLAAFTLPQVVGDYLVGGTLAFAIMPVLARIRKQRGEKDAWRLLASVVRTATAFLLAFSIAYAAGAPLLIRLLAPGFPLERMGLAVKLARVLSPALFFMGMILVGAAVIQSYRHFVVTAIGSVLASLMPLLTVAFLSDRLGIQSWAAGVVIGLGVQLLLYAWVLRAVGMSLRSPLPRSDEAVRSLCRLIAPLLVGIVAAQSNVIVQRILASRVQAGITSLDYSRMLMMLPISFAIGPLLGALFPLFAEQAAENTPGEVRKTCALGLRMVLFVGVPATILLITLRRPVVTLLFEWGKFGRQDTELVSTLLLYHAAAMCFLSGAAMLYRALCALEMSCDLLWVNLCVGASCVVNFVLFHTMGVPGLALATCIVCAVSCVAGFTLLSRRIGLVIGLGDLGPILRILASGCAAAAAAGVVSRAIEGSNLANVLVTSLATVIGYVALSAALRSPELRLIWSRLIGRK